MDMATRFKILKEAAGVSHGTNINKKAKHVTILPLLSVNTRTDRLFNLAIATVLQEEKL